MVVPTTDMGTILDRSGFWNHSWHDRNHAHRMGASVNIPYGLLIAYLMVIISTWSARSRDGVSGLALHLIGSSLAVWTVMAGYGPGGDAMIPVGFGGDDSMPFFSEQAGYFWLYGVVLIPIVMLVLPKCWFVTPPRKKTHDDAVCCLPPNERGRNVWQRSASEMISS